MPKTFFIGVVCFLVVMTLSMCTGYLLHTAWAQGYGTGDYGGVSKDTIDALCANQGALVYKILSYIGGTTLVASFVANSKSVHSRFPMLGSILNILAVNWSSWIRQAAQDAANQKGVK